MFKLALVQMRVDGGQKAENLARAEQRIAAAAAGGAQVVLLPEALDLGWTDPSAKAQAEPVPAGEPCRRLQEAARTYGVYVCAGLTELAPQDVYNTAVLIGPDGELLLHHRKLNELDIGHEFYAAGDRLSVVRTPPATFGVMICADGFAESLTVARTLCYMGADVILSPCAWAVPADHDNDAQPYGQTWRRCYEPIARDYAVWIAGCSNVGPMTGGPWKGRRCIGCSLVMAPGGREVVQGPYGAEAESVLTVDVEPAPRPARGTGWAALRQKENS